MIHEDKKELFRTGGGPATIRCVSNPVKELTIGLMNPKTVVGFENNFDSDAIQNQNPETDENANSRFDLNYDILDIDNTIGPEVCQDDYLFESNNDDHQYCKDQPSTLTSVVSPMSTDLNSTSFAQATDSTGKKRSLPIKSKKITKDFSSRQKQTECLKTPWVKRRRPAIQQLPSSKLSEEYLCLSKIKQECFPAEEENIKAREKREQELFELQKKKLVLEIEINETKLNLLKNKSN